MFDPFSITIFGHHVWSDISFISAMVVTFLLVRNTRPIYRTLIAATVGALGITTYDVIFIPLAYPQRDSFTITLISLILLLMLVSENYFFHFLRPDFLSLILIMMYICTIEGLWITGLYRAVGEFGVGPVPWMWAASKALGFFVWVGLIK